MVTKNTTAQRHQPWTRKEAFDVYRKAHPDCILDQLFGRLARGLAPLERQALNDLLEAADFVPTREGIVMVTVINDRTAEVLCAFAAEDEDLEAVEDDWEANIWDDEPDDWDLEEDFRRKGIPGRAKP